MGAQRGMRHRNTELLFGYWTKLRGGRRVPSRADVEPRAIKRLLPDLFIIDRIGRNRYQFALAGTRLCWLYGRELKESNFLSHWNGPSERQIRDLLEESLRAAQPIAIYAIAETPDHRTLRIEIIVLPVADSRGAINRLIGAVTPLDPVMALGERKLVHQWLVASDRLGEPSAVQDIETPPDSPSGPTGPSFRASQVPYLRLVVSRDENQAAPKLIGYDGELPFLSFFMPGMTPAN